MSVPTPSSPAALMCGSLDKVDRTRLPQKGMSLQSGPVGGVQSGAVRLSVSQSRSMRVIVLKGFKGLISTAQLQVCRVCLLTPPPSCCPAAHLPPCVASNHQLPVASCNSCQLEHLISLMHFCSNCQLRLALSPSFLPPASRSLFLCCHKKLRSYI